MLIVPATGNTISKLANNITDTVPTVALKSHLRNNKPVIIGICTSDALKESAKNIGTLLDRKNFYFIPFMQDNPITKPYSVVFNHNLLLKTIKMSLEGEQIQPLLM